MILYFETRNNGHPFCPVAFSIFHCTRISCFCGHRLHLYPNYPHCHLHLLSFSTFQSIPLPFREDFCSSAHFSAMGLLFCFTLEQSACSTSCLFTTGSFFFGSFSASGWFRCLFLKVTVFNCLSSSFWCFPEEEFLLGFDFLSTSLTHSSSEVTFDWSRWVFFEAVFFFDPPPWPWLCLLDFPFVFDWISLSEQYPSFEESSELLPSDSLSSSCNCIGSFPLVSSSYVLSWGGPRHRRFSHRRSSGHSLVYLFLLQVLSRFSLNYSLLLSLFCTHDNFYQIYKSNIPICLLEKKQLILVHPWWRHYNPNAKLLCMTSIVSHYTPFLNTWHIFRQSLACS